MKSFTSIGNNKGRGIGVMVLMVTKYKKKKVDSKWNQSQIYYLNGNLFKFVYGDS